MLVEKILGRKMLKSESSKTSNEEYSGVCVKSNTDQSYKKPSISVETMLKEEDLTLVSSTNAPSSSNEEDSKLLTVPRKRKSRSPIPGSKTSGKKFIDWENLSPRRSNDCIFDAIPPNIDSLRDAYLKNYQKRLLSKMLDYSLIIKDYCFLEYGSGRKVKILRSDLVNQKFDDGNETDKVMLIILKFLVGVTQLQSGELRRGKQLIKEAANEKLPHAMYTSAIITFADFVQCCYSNKDSNGKKSKRPNRQELKDAIRYMIDVKRQFFPLPNFVLGMIQLCKVDYLTKVIEEMECTNSTIWSEYFNDILITGISEDGSETSYLWENLLKLDDYRNLDGKLRLNLPAYGNSRQKYMDVVKDEDGEFLKWIIQSIKFDLAKELLEKEHLTLAKSLLKELSSQGFVDSNYVYAFALLKNQFRDGQTFASHNFNEAFNHLNSAVTYGHQEAMLLFGIMPFRKEFDLIEKDSRGKRWACIDALINYVMLGNEDFRKEAAKLVAAEYLKRDDFYSAYSEERAKFILTTSGCFDELRELERNLLARKNAATDALPDVLKALEEIKSKVEKCVYAGKLLPILHLILNALKDRELYIRKSRKNLLQLELINLDCADMDTSTMERRILIAVQLMCDVLQTHVDSLSHCSIKQKVLTLLKTCVTIQMESIDLY